MSHDVAAAAKAAAVDSLDEVARALKRQAEATKQSLQAVRRAQAQLVGIELSAPTAQIHSARAALAGSTTQPQGGHSDTAKEDPRAA